MYTKEEIYIMENVHDMSEIQHARELRVYKDEFWYRNALIIQFYDNFPFSGIRYFEKLGTPVLTLTPNYKKELKVFLEDVKTKKLKFKHIHLSTWSNLFFDDRYRFHFMSIIQEFVIELRREEYSQADIDTLVYVDPLLNYNLLTPRSKALSGFGINKIRLKILHLMRMKELRLQDRMDVLQKLSCY